MPNIYTWDNLKLFLPTLFSVFYILWPVWLLIAIKVIYKFGYGRYEKRKLAESGINDIDRMSGKNFEKYLEVIFEKLGYRVERTPYVGDYGADLVTSKDGIKTVIQAKRHKGKVGIKAVQEAVAAKGKYGCTEAMVVTNSYYTRQAIELAKSNKVELWDRKKFIKELLLLKKLGKISAPTLVNEVAASEGNYSRDNNNSGISSNECATCGKPVSEKVKLYCLSNKGRFGGKVYCYDHQKR